MTLTQPDGSVLQARVVGDEFAHLMVDLQGNALIQNSEGWWCYAAFSGDGSMHSTGTVAGTSFVRHLRRAATSAKC